MTAPLDSTTVARYLTEHPHFFAEHADLLGEVKLTSPLHGRAISLQERQMEVMRERYKALERRMAELIRLARENGAIAGRFHSWAQAMLPLRRDADLPQALIDGLKNAFQVPQATLRLWDVAPAYRDAWFARGVSDDARMFANSLLAPYCGGNHDFEAVRWLGSAEPILSTVILPLRPSGGKAPAFGLLILGAPDPARFTADRATDFLLHIGATASAALGALRA